jgi:transcriptional regulator with GAF, ATPase, and Fis domain
VIMTSGPDLHVSLGSVNHQKTFSTNRTLVEAEREHIMEALRQVDWVVGGCRGAAARLGLPRTTLISRMHKLGIVRKTESPSDLETRPAAFAAVAGY